MKILGNSRLIKKFISIEITNKGSIQESHYKSQERNPLDQKIHGIFDTINGQKIYLFYKDCNIFLGNPDFFHPFQETEILYNRRNDDRTLKIAWPTGKLTEINYNFYDLVENKALLWGSHEEIEDYDFGCLLYSLHQSPERQKLTIETWQ